MPVAVETLPPAVLEKLNATRARLAELRARLDDPAVLSDPKTLVPITRESGQLEPVAERYDAYTALQQEVADLQQMADAGDDEMAQLAASELPDAASRLATMHQDLLDALLTVDDEAAAVERFFIEVRAGTGGEEAALFCRDLFEMYRKFCEANGYHFEASDFSESERGGFKEVIMTVRGSGAYQRLQFESGGHRVQRVPETESQGRIHTSAATVAIMPELADVQIHIDPRDIEEQGCRGGGPGGQNVNKVETGWRITHKPSGLQFKMTEHKSQTQNKERAWALLRSTLYEFEKSKQHAEQTGLRRSLMGSGDRSQRVRTYSFPQNRCTDHRLGGEGSDSKNFNLDKIMLGELNELLAALEALDKQQRLAQL